MRPAGAGRCLRGLAWSLVLHQLFRGAHRTIAMDGTERILLAGAEASEIADGPSDGDLREDSLFDPIQADPDCMANDGSCYDLPDTTIEYGTTATTTNAAIDATCSYGGADPDGALGADAPAEALRERRDRECPTAAAEAVVDKHWGSDPRILGMREKLRRSGSGASSRARGHPHAARNQRPPIFLMPGLASTRLVAWRFKACPHHPLLSDIKVQDYVWLNINLLLQMSSLSIDCFKECLALGWNQSDTDDAATGCKLRPDEGLDAISSLSPGGIGSSMLIGGTNTVYAWLIQWLAENLGYDVSNIVGLPYDWRLSPDKMEARDGFLTLTRRRIEAAVESNGSPGIVVAHSMGNLVFRYFLEWMRAQLKEEAYQRYIRQARRRAKALQKAPESAAKPGPSSDGMSSFLSGWMQGVVSGFDEWWSTVTKDDATEGVPSERHDKLWELAQLEGDDMFFEWVEKHIWSFVGLSAPMLGAVNPLRAVISGESMGLPMTDDDARDMEVTFGSTHTVNPISTKEGFCDSWDAERWEEKPSKDKSNKKHSDARLACLDDIYSEIEYGPLLEDLPLKGDPWEYYPALRAFLKERRDWDSDFPMMSIIRQLCDNNEKPPCKRNDTIPFGPQDVQTGDLFTVFNAVFREKDEPLRIKREQLQESFWESNVKNFLNRTWERPIIKHVILAYGVDVPTEIAYEYQKVEQVDHNELDGVPRLSVVHYEVAGGNLEEEHHTGKGFPDLFGKKKRKRSNHRKGSLPHSGDGSVPYLSLAWAHTWLLHAGRALRYSHPTGEGLKNPLDEIEISHRPQGAMKWEKGPPPERAAIPIEKKVEESSDTGTSHPHGTKYKPEMIRYHNTGTSRTTGIEYTTTVIEAIQVEHKETTRNYDILAAVFTDILEFMHDDMEL